MSNRFAKRTTQTKRAWPTPGSFFLAALLIALSGCSSVVVLPPNTRSLPQHVELTETPFYPQEDYQCGPAALATVLNFYDRNVSPEGLVKEVYIPDIQGSLAVEIIAASRRHDMLAVKLTPTLDALLAEIANGRPVLVFQNLGLPSLPRWHFAVAIGYDLERSEIILRSGTTKRWITPLATFQRTWQRAESWALVIVPAGELPATSTKEHALEAASALEKIGRHAAAYQGFRAISQRWPDDKLARMGLGNNAYQLTHYHEAEQQFRHVLRFDSQDAAAWNNLAYSLAAQGCHRQAQQAVQCATTLAPLNVEYRNSATELNSLTSSSPSTCQPISCPAPIQ